MLLPAQGLGGQSNSPNWEIGLWDPWSPTPALLCSPGSSVQVESGGAGPSPEGGGRWGSHCYLGRDASGVWPHASFRMGRFPGLQTEGCVPAGPANLSLFCYKGRQVGLSHHPGQPPLSRVMAGMAMAGLPPHPSGGLRVPGRPLQISLGGQAPSLRDGCDVGLRPFCLPHRHTLAWGQPWCLGSAGDPQQ